MRIKAAALNFFDLLIIAGKYQHKPPFPFSPASEFAGIVESVGAGVTDFAPGDRVMGSTGWGAARESSRRRHQQLVKLPDNARFRARRRADRHLRNDALWAARARQT